MLKQVLGVDDKESTVGSQQAAAANTEKGSDRAAILQPGRVDRTAQVTRRRRMLVDHVQAIVDGCVDEVDAVEQFRIGKMVGWRVDTLFEDVADGGFDMGLRGRLAELAEPVLRQIGQQPPGFSPEQAATK